MSEKEEFPDFEDDTLLVLTYARTAKEAETIRILLEDHDIPVTITEDDDDFLPAGDKHKGIAILVPAEDMADAQGVIQERSELDDEFVDQLENLDDDDDDDDDFNDMDGFGPENLDDDDIFEELDDHDLDIGDDDFDDLEDLY